MLKLVNGSSPSRYTVHGASLPDWNPGFSMGIGVAEHAGGPQREQDADAGDASTTLGTSRTASARAAKPTTSKEMTSIVALLVRFLSPLIEKWKLLELALHH